MREAHVARIQTSVGLKREKEQAMTAPTQRYTTDYYGHVDSIHVVGNIKQAQPHIPTYVLFGSSSWTGTSLTPRMVLMALKSSCTTAPARTYWSSVKTLESRVRMQMQLRSVLRCATYRIVEGCTTTCTPCRVRVRTWEGVNGARRSQRFLVSRRMAMTAVSLATPLQPEVSMPCSRMTRCNRTVVNAGTRCAAPHGYEAGAVPCSIIA
jgi:hypothetical protein